MIFDLPSLSFRFISFNRKIGHKVGSQLNNLIMRPLRFYQALILSTLLLSIAGCTKLGVETANQKTIDSFDNSSITKVLNELIQVDIDTYHAYMHAARELKTGKVHQLLKNFAADHERHVTDLSKVVLNLGGHPPSFSRDFKGFLTTGYVAIKMAGGAKKTLEAMETNEIISNRYYNKALATYMPSNIKEVLERHLKNEKHHLERVKELQKQLK